MTNNFRKPFTVSLTPLSGDPDLYVSTITASPTALDYQWSGFKPGFDVIKIAVTDPKYKEGAYYIGVRGFSDSAFTIEVTSDDQYTRIIEGVPMSSTVLGGATNLFKFKLLHKQRLVVNTIPLTDRGDPDIYVAVDNSKIPGPDNHIAQRASAGADSLTIDNAEPMLYYIGIKGFARDTDFQLIVTSEQKNDELIDGQVQYIYNDQNVRIFST